MCKYRRKYKRGPSPKPLNLRPLSDLLSELNELHRETKQLDKKIEVAMVRHPDARALFERRRREQEMLKPS